MKRKGITIWEQHLERIVLAAAVLFFLAFGAWQFMSEPNAMDRPGGGTVTPGEIDQLLEETANDLQLRLAPDASAPFEIPDPAPVYEEFVAAIGDNVSADAMVAVNDATLTPGEGAGRRPTPGDAKPYYEPVIAAVANVVVQQNHDAILPEEIQAFPELQELYPRPPHDASWTTVAGVFDVNAALEQLQMEGSGGEAQIPSSWHRNQIEILNVVLEREEKVDGRWANAQKIKPIPGQRGVVDLLAGATNLRAAEDIRAQLRDGGLQEAILRPEFYLTKSESFVPPNPRAAEIEADDFGLSDDEIALRRMVQDLMRRKAGREQMAEDMRDLGGQPPEPPAKEGAGRGGRGAGDEEDDRTPPGESGGGSRGGGAGGGGSAPPGGGGFGSGGTGGGRREAPKEKRRAPGSGFGLGGGGEAGGDTGNKDQKKLDRLEQRIRAEDRKIENLMRRLRAKGWDENAQPEEDTEADDGMLLVWAHDIGIKPNRTYRYRMTLELYNPFFAKKLYLADAQHGLADNITLASQVSEWSPERLVIPDRTIFVTKAHGADGRNPGSLGMGQLTAEVFRFYDGRWWLKEFHLQPGDRVGGTQTMRPEGAAVLDVDFGTRWFVLDVISDIDRATDRTTVDRGLAASALLQSIEDASVMLHADPIRAANDPERARLHAAVEDAELPDLASRDG